MSRLYDVSSLTYGALGKLPSVTSILSATYNKNRYGPVSPGSFLSKNINYRAQVGTEVHKMAECFLLGKDWPYDFHPTSEAQTLFKCVQPQLSSLKIFRGPSGGLAIERIVYSYSLMVGGRVDFVVERTDGTLEVWDLKTAGSKRSKDAIWGYMLQASAYACCIQEMSGRPVSRCVLLFVYATKNSRKILAPYTEEFCIDGPTIESALNEFKIYRDEFQRLSL
jgi:hypothetical protein